METLVKLACALNVSPMKFPQTTLFIFREAVSLKRLQQLRIGEPSLVMRDDKHKMVEVGGLDDPDFDAEVIGEEPAVNQFDYKLDSGFFRGG